MSCQVCSFFAKLFIFLSASYIAKSYDKALEEREDAQEEFEKLDSTTSDEQRSKWLAQEVHAQANRLHDVKAMDIYSSKLERGESIALASHRAFFHRAFPTELFSPGFSFDFKAPPRAQLELERMEQEQAAGNHVGLTAWIVEGIEIQQQQLRIQDEITQHPNPTTNQEIKVSKMKEKLIQRFESLMNTAEFLFPDVDFTELAYRPSPWSTKKAIQTQ